MIEKYLHVRISRNELGGFDAVCINTQDCQFGDSPVQALSNLTTAILALEKSYPAGIPLKEAQEEQRDRDYLQLEGVLAQPLLVDKVFDLVAHTEVEYVYVTLAANRHNRIPVYGRIPKT